MKKSDVTINNIPIKNIIIILFIMMMLATVGLIGTIIFYNWFSSADSTLSIMAEEVNANAFNEVDSLINVPVHINEVNHNFIEKGIIDINNEYERESFFVNVLNHYMDEAVYSFSYGTENGEYYGARKNENNEIEIMRNNASTNGNSWYYSLKEDMTAGERVVEAGKFDPRTRDWYKTAKALQKPAFSPIYKHFVMEDLTVSAAYPIYEGGHLKGVLGTHITLSIIDKHLKEIMIKNNGFAVIVEQESGNLIANSLKIENYKKLEDGRFDRVNIEQINNPIVFDAYNKYIESKEAVYRIENESDRFFVNLTEYHKEGLDWLVITAIPESLFVTQIMDNIKLALLLTALGIVASILIYFTITKKYLKPIDELIEATEQFSQGNLTYRVEIARNDEIGSISKAFNKMADTIYTLIYSLEKKVKERTNELEVTNFALTESKDKLQLILDSTAEGIYGIDKEGNCTFCNNSSLKMLGYKEQSDLIGTNMHLLIHYADSNGQLIPKNQCKIYQALQTGVGKHADNEVFWKADGTSIDVEYSSYPQFKEGKIVGAVITFRDNTDRKKHEERINYLNNHDFSTNLYNRRYFENSLRRLNQKEYLPIAIIFGDVNGLKLTNDIFGHKVGDELLLKTAEVLKRICRENDIVSRVGGDEFAILLPNTEQKNVEMIIERIKGELAKEKIAAIKCSMSMGYDLKETMEQDLEATMRSAEDRMYKEKTLTRNAINSDMIKTIIETLYQKCPGEKQHAHNVGEICGGMARLLNLSEPEVKKIKEAGLLHDIGKIVIDQSILNKQDKLTDEELMKFQQHTTVGYRILNLFDNTLDFAESILNHHENWDGTGYPKGLKGKEIPFIARIIGIADSYDEMVTGMYENKPITKEEALNEIIEQSGKKYDPELVDVFIKLVKII